MSELVRLLFEPSPARLEIYAIGYQLAWIVALLLGMLGAYAARRHIARHMRPLLAVGATATLVRVLFCDFHTSSEQWPYITQAVCMAFDEARAGYNLCSIELFGDNHQLGTASLFALGFRVFGGYKAVAGTLVLLASVLNVLLVYAVTQRAFAKREASFAASMILALHPAAIYFSGATQTEAFNDTFLALAALLVTWDAESLSRDRPTSWAGRAAANPMLRAFLVAMAVNVRPESLVLLPVLATSAALSATPVRRTVLSVGGLILASIPLLVPVLPGALLKAHHRTSLQTQIVYDFGYLRDAYELLLGPIGLLLVVVGFAVVLLRSEREGRWYARYVLAMATVYVVAQGLFEHVPRSQPHVLYHGSILWWPAVGSVLARIAGFAARRDGWPWSKNASRWLAIVVSVAALGFLAPASPPLRLSLLNPRLRDHHRILEAIPPHAHVVPVTLRMFQEGGVAAALFSQGGFTVHAPAVREFTDFNAFCIDVCPSLDAPLAEGRPVRLVERCDSAPRETFPNLAETCGIGLGEERLAGGFYVAEVRTACTVAAHPTRDRPPPRTAPADPSSCPFSISPDTARRVFETAKASALQDGCKLEAVDTQRSFTKVKLTAPDGAILSASVVPVGCSRDGIVGDSFTLLPASALREACPNTYGALVELVGTSRMGEAIETERKGAHRPVLPWLPRLGAMTAAALIAFAILMLARRRWNLAPGRFEPAALSLTFGGVVAFVAFAIPFSSANSCLQPMDYRWLVGGLDPSLPSVSSLRPLASLETRWGFLLAGLSAARWVWLVGVVHLINATLVAWLCRELRVRRNLTWIAGMLFFAAPALTGAFSVEYLLEVVTVTAWLLLCAAYLARRRCGEERRRMWLAIEVLAVALGVGNKESFVIYPLALIGLELSLLGREVLQRPAIREALRRLLPHAVVFALAAIVALPRVMESGGRKVVSYSPIEAVEKMSALVGGAAGAGFGAGLPNVLAGAAIVGLVFGLVMVRPRHSHALRAGAVLLLVLSLPMLVLPGRLFPGYLPHAWPGVVIVAVGAIGELRSTRLRVGILGWMASVLLARPVVELPAPCLIGNAVDSELSGERASCSDQPPTWNVSEQVFEAAVREVRTVDPSRPRQDASELVRQTFHDHFRLVCRRADVQIHLPKSGKNR